jgi:hypothetical protein
VGTTYIDRKGNEEAACGQSARVTRSLLGYGVLAGPFYVGMVLAQALLLRPGFDLVHDDASLLSNGNLGWIQIANFIVTGLMVIACAVGLRRVLVSGRGSMWGPALLGLYGLGLIAAGIFVADPMNGFPAGAPAGRPDSVTVHGLLHIASAGIGFIAMAAACFVLSRRYSTWFSIVTGVAFLAAFAGLASGSNSAVVVIAFWAALILVWAWIGSLSIHMYREVTRAA